MQGGDSVKADRKEILRYLGYGQAKADETINQLIEECITEVEKAASPKVITQVFPLVFMEGNRIDLGCFQAESKNLSKNLKDCEQVIFFAATLGIGVDQLIAKYSKFQMSRVVVIQAVATAMLEDFCDECCKQLESEWKEKDWYLRPRFSPGYGDFLLECQKSLLGALEASKRVGIHLTDSLLMTPSKSVSAVIGLSRKPHRCEIKGCEVCDKKECAYRRS